MDFRKLAKKCELQVAKLSIKNKGSIVDLTDYYINLYNALIEKWGLECAETRYVHTEKTAGGVKAIEWDWFSYKELDDFARLRFNYSTNAYRVKGDKVMGIFSLKYTLELDYNHTWRNSPLLKWFLPYYLKLFYFSRLDQWIGRYKSELNSIKDTVRELLNVSVFD